jgi:hypothetical protein
MKPNHSPRGRKIASRSIACLLITAAVVAIKPMMSIIFDHPKSRLSLIVTEAQFVGSQFTIGVSRLYFALMSDDANPPFGMVRESQATALSNELPKGLSKVGSDGALAATGTR